MWLETKNGDVHLICSPPSNLRHSASFSCLSKNTSQLSEKPYRARTATLTPGDIDYGFAVRRNKDASELRASYNSCSGGDLASSEKTLETGIDTKDVAAAAAKNERPNLLREMLIKKSVNLLNPNVWWSPKFRNLKSTSKSGADKNMQEMQSQKRWRSLGALLKANPNNSRPSNAQPSLRAQSFYLLDDFLVPSESRHPMNGAGAKALEGNLTTEPNNLSDSLQISSPKSPPVPPPPARYQECKNSNECSPYMRCRECSLFSSSVSRYNGKETIPVRSLKANNKVLTQKGRQDRQYLELPVLQSRTAFTKWQYDLCTSRAHENYRTNAATGTAATTAAAANLENHKSETTFIVTAQPQQQQVDPHTAIKSSSYLHSNSLYSLPQSKFERSHIKTGSSFNSSSNSSDTTNSNFTTTTTTNTSTATTEQHMKRIPTKPPGKSFPLTSAEALLHYGSFLTEYEKKEIGSYNEVWFLGLKACKIRGEENSGYNFGYDDENGNYNKILNDHLYYRYEVLEVLGKGSFGQVVKAFDHKNGIFVAIKIIRNKKRFYHQAQVELVILNHLRRKDTSETHNVIHMLDYFYFRRHLCISFELLYMNLYEVIKRNGYQGFSLPVVRNYASSLVQCLRLLYREKIIHCDLKPENILLQKQNSQNLKVIDFGSSCYTYQKVYTYIQSRFYRSPEIILGLPYNNAIDMWSFGCILTELYTGYPLFPGENEVEQLACIMEVIGLPPYEVLVRASRRKLFFDAKGSPRPRKRKPGSKDLTEVLRCDDALFIDFISRCLEWNPDRRLTAEEAIQHDWLKDYAHNENSVSSVRIEDTDCFLPS